MMNSQFSVEEKFFKITDVTHYIEEKLKIMLYSEKRSLKSSLNNNRIRRIVCLDVESIAKWTTKSEPSDYVYQLSNQTNCFVACRWTWQREIKFAPVNRESENANIKRTVFWRIAKREEYTRHGSTVCTFGCYFEYLLPRSSFSSLPPLFFSQIQIRIFVFDVELEFKFKFECEIKI